MKNFRRIVLAVMVVLIASAGANAQFRFGVKAGVAINSLHFDKSDLSSDNRAGFTGGLTTEFTVPLIGIGFDASLMYVHRATVENETVNDVTKLNRDYIELPINLKYKLSIPVVEKIIKPYLFTGPSFAFLVSKESATEFIKNKKCDVAWNFGFGVELLSHLQVGASYGLGITKAVEVTGLTGASAGIEGKNRYWTVTAAYLF